MPTMRAPNVPICTFTAQKTAKAKLAPKLWVFTYLKFDSEKKVIDISRVAISSAQIAVFVRSSTGVTKMGYYDV